jgi:hypothetical protein
MSQKKKSRDDGDGLVVRVTWRASKAAITALDKRVKADKKGEFASRNHAITVAVSRLLEQP